MDSLIINTNILYRRQTKQINKVDNTTWVYIQNSQLEFKADEWSIIIDKEGQINQKISELQIPHLTLEKCNVNYEGRDFDTFLFPSFDSYNATDQIYIIDLQNIDITQWKLQNQYKEYDEDQWKQILTPLIIDINLMAKNKIKLVAQSINFAFVMHGSRYHSGSQQEFEVRFFAFDLVQTSEFEIFNTIIFHESNQILRRIVETVFRIQYCDCDMFLTPEYKEHANNLILYFQKQLINNEKNKSCIIN